MKIKLPKTQIICFALILIICVIAIGEAVYLLVFSEGKEENPTTGTINYEELKENFNDIFQNTIQTNNSNEEIKKKEEDKELIYVNYAKKEIKEGSYDLDVSIPVINIDAVEIEKSNTEIQKTFQEKANTILAGTQTNTVYSVKYEAYLNGDILSIVIKSTLKEGDNAQRVIIKTYNYNVKTMKFVTIDEMLLEKQLDKQTMGNKIKEEIKQENEQAKALKELGYNVFNRDLRSDMYELEQINNFFLDKDNNLYIIYAYGNNNYTSEVDLVIF